jgi:ATP-dependent Clp protease ATP-binding subunit ClpA
MFERFTDRARRVVVLSQEEARELQHNYIGTEHVLLGLLRERDGVAARALDRFGMSPAAIREEVKARVGLGSEPMKGHIPFTPRAKKILELALREALQLGHNYIGTEHLLLGLVREGDGVGAQIIAAHAGDLAAVRSAVLDVLPTAQLTPVRRWLRSSAASSGELPELQTTPAGDTSLEAAIRLAGSRPVGSHHLLLAAISDPDTAAARTLAALGIDLDRAREALRDADVTDTSDELPEEKGRRHMLIRSTGDRLTIEVTDQAIIDLGLDALKALGDQSGESGEAGEPGTIRGDQPVSASLGNVWQALHDSLEDIRRRAIAAKAIQARQETQSGQEGQETQSGQEGQRKAEES